MLLERSLDLVPSAIVGAMDLVADGPRAFARPFGQAVDAFSRTAARSLDGALGASKRAADSPRRLLAAARHRSPALLRTFAEITGLLAKRRPLRLRLAFGLAAPLLAVGLVVGLAGPRIDEASRVLTELGGAKPLLFRLAPVLEEGHRDAGPYEERRRRMALERVRDALPSVLRSFAGAGMLLVASKEVDHI